MSILTRKYPFPQSSHWLRDSIIDSAIVFLILYLLQEKFFEGMRQQQ